MTQPKSTIDPFIKIIFLLKNIGFLIALLFIFALCLENTYNRIYGDNHRKNKLENLLKNGKTVFADFDDQYMATQVQSRNSSTTTYEYKYSYKVDGEVYSDVLSTTESIPQNPDRLIKFMTVHYLPDNPEVKQIDLEVELDDAIDKVNEHSIVILLLNIFGLFISFILILYVIILISDKIKNLDKPIEKTSFQNRADYENVNQKTDYSKIR
jgi:hypothetical protein